MRVAAMLQTRLYSFEVDAEDTLRRVSICAGVLGYDAEPMQEVAGLLIRLGGNGQVAVRIRRLTERTALLVFDGSHLSAGDWRETADAIDLHLLSKLEFAMGPATAVQRDDRQRTWHRRMTTAID